ncbi:hypothetical protein [Roseicyclus sp.]|uniref:hypothetical protein n=1 Tax=Roseicyclus sp. TaxID=1914329 RepID=UPI003F6A8435
MSSDKPAPDPIDPKGLIRESFRIDGITDGECRSIFVDWALSLSGAEPREAISALLARYDDAPITHPMLAVLRAGLEASPKGGRRGGRAARVSQA